MMMGNDKRDTNPRAPSQPGNARPAADAKPRSKKTSITFVVPSNKWGKVPDPVEKSAALTVLMPKDRKPKR